MKITFVNNTQKVWKDVDGNTFQPSTLTTFNATAGDRDTHYIYGPIDLPDLPYGGELMRDGEREFVIYVSQFEGEEQPAIVEGFVSPA
jgi:hypothetical protein